MDWTYLEVFLLCTVCGLGPPRPRRASGSAVRRFGKFLDCPLVNIQKAMENGHKNSDLPINSMVDLSIVFWDCYRRVTSCIFCLAWACWGKPKNGPTRRHGVFWAQLVGGRGHGACRAGIMGCCRDPQDVTWEDGRIQFPLGTFDNTNRNITMFNGKMTIIAGEITLWLWLT